MWDLTQPAFYEPQPHPEDMQRGICSECGDPCWERPFHQGYRGWRIGSSCCEAEVIQENDDEGA